MLYTFLTILLIDIVRILNYFLHFIPNFVYDNYNNTKFILGLAIVIITTVIIILGFLNTKKIRIKTLNLTIARKKSSFQNLNAVLVSDIHLSPLNDEKFSSTIVKKINELNPDIVFIAGDIVDDNAKTLTARNIGVSLKNITAKHGVFVCTGNHEFINGIKGCEEYIRNLSFNLLRDKTYLLKEGLLIVGRDDSSMKSFDGKSRKSLEEIMMNESKDYPVILLDHTPFKLEQAEKNNIDLQLSGHTHHGQLFPLNFITSMIYEKSRGYLKKVNTQYYVSCGVGTWGPRVRTGSISEIINLKLEFV
jgi:predicted MPP superfamily phosphohydrolase